MRFRGRRSMRRVPGGGTVHDLAREVLDIASAGLTRARRAQRGGRQ